VLGGGAVGGGIDGADDDGVEDVDDFDRDVKQRRDEDRRRRNETAAEDSSRRGDALGGAFGEKLFEKDAAAAFAAALSALDERRLARPDPAVEIARLKERNKALRRELEVAQRLMTGYHAQLMTGGAAERFATARNNAYANRGGPPPVPSYAARRAFVRRPFAAPASVDRPPPFRSEFSKEKHPMAPMAGLRSTLRAESKRTAAELAALTAERAYAETAADLDEDEFDQRDASSSAALGDDGASRDVAQIARDVAALKETVAGLVGRMDADRERSAERSRGSAERSLSGNALDVSADVSSASRSNAAPASEISFGVLRDLPPSASSRSRMDEHERVSDENQTVADVETSPGMSLETDTAFLRTPAKTFESPGGGGEVESTRVDTPVGSVSN
jgi:hypothetical protein